MVGGGGCGLRDKVGNQMSLGQASLTPLSLATIHCDQSARQLAATPVDYAPNEDPIFPDWDLDLLRANQSTCQKVMCSS